MTLTAGRKVGRTSAGRRRNQASRTLDSDAAPANHSPPLEDPDVPERQLIDQGSNKRYSRRDARGRFTTDQVEVGRSLAADRRTKAKTVAPKGQGDRGDQRRT